MHTHTHADTHALTTHTHTHTPCVHVHVNLMHIYHEHNFTCKCTYMYVASLLYCWSFHSPFLPSPLSSFSFVLFQVLRLASVFLALVVAANFHGLSTLDQLYFPFFVGFLLGGIGWCKNLLMGVMNGRGCDLELNKDSSNKLGSE